MYKVIIIDDEPWSREVVKALGEWETLKLKVIGEAEDGSEGLRLITELKPDIVITDMRMPGIDGIELLKEINDEYKELKIIVTSGYNDFIYLKQAIRSRAIEYILKPINTDELNAALMRCIDELNQENINLGAQWKQQISFKNPMDINSYFSYRQLVFEYLLSLNKSEVINTLEKLEVFLKDSLEENNYEDMLNKIGHNFIFMIKEFITENKVELKGLENIINQEDSGALRWKSVSEMMNCIRTIYAESITFIEELHKNRNRFDINEVKNFIERHYKDPISLDTIAQYFFVSKEHLIRSFKINIGENISDYIVRMRMEKARELIVEKNLEIKNVAEIIGYADIPYFYRVFKKHFGITPGDMQRQL